MTAPRTVAARMLHDVRIGGVTTDAETQFLIAAHAAHNLMRTAFREGPHHWAEVELYADVESLLTDRANRARSMRVQAITDALTETVERVRAVAS